jgi:hypothetical protein
MTMSEKLERMLRTVMMNQIEIMTALEDLLGQEPVTQEDYDHRDQTRAALSDAIEHSLDHLKDLNRQDRPEREGVS